VAITEKYFSPNYFDKSLTGARADQEVLKELTSRKLPTVFHHLESIDIELSTISINWFLAMFFDAVPFQVVSTSEKLFGTRERLSWKGLSRRLHFAWHCYYVEWHKRVHVNRFPLTESSLAMFNSLTVMTSLQ